MRRVRRVAFYFASSALVAFAMGCNAVVGNEDITYVDRQGQTGDEPPDIDDTDTDAEDAGAKDAGSDADARDGDADGDIDADVDGDIDGGPSDGGAGGGG